MVTFVQEEGVWSTSSTNSWPQHSLNIMLIRLLSPQMNFPANYKRSFFLRQIKQRIIRIYQFPIFDGVAVIQEREEFRVHIRTKVEPLSPAAVKVPRIERAYNRL